MAKENNLREKLESEIKSGSEASIIKLVSHLIELAYDLKASDIHISPEDDLIRVRLRIDGVLQDEMPLPKAIHLEVISRIKILANLRTDEHQAAQDGRFRINLEKSEVDIRVSMIPTYSGENAVMRLLTDQSQDFNLDQMGFSESDKTKISKAVKHSYGMILATGPTGSGKTTTLYTLIKMLNTTGVSIITIEDPIEYSVKGINQIGVNSKTGLTFANGLRSILRQDPNIIMVGEIRDAETAGIAVNTALTGHLLLSSPHTNDSATTLPRLLDLGIEPYLIASTVNVAIGQRLVRKVCSDCRVPDRLTESERKSLTDVIPAALLKGKKFYKGKGCEACGGTGYRGRVGLYEVLLLDADIREAILRKASGDEINALALKQGMTPMLHDGVEKAAAGQTTIQEVLRILHE